MKFAALVVGPSAEASGNDMAGVCRLEIVAGAVVIRLEAGVSAERIASVVRALAAYQ